MAKRKERVEKIIRTLREVEVLQVTRPRNYPQSCAPFADGEHLRV